ncbi:MAG: hypothetical protein JRI67_11105 [Deltaproteobacteria bacterium]|nr:hypothetical protein [Deltaproteobacteria bacterium]MBW2081422.1 hypothetical protein [Deltaproteobacteria bacterium]
MKETPLFQFIQRHTVIDKRGHRVAVKGVPARFGPFEIKKIHAAEIITVDYCGMERAFNPVLWAYYRVI